MFLDLLCTRARVERLQFSWVWCLLFGSFHPKLKGMRAWRNLEVSMVWASVKWPWLKWDMKTGMVLIQLGQIQLTSQWINLHETVAYQWNKIVVKCHVKERKWRWTSWLIIRFLPNESCIHALFIKLKLVLHNIGDRGLTNRAAVTMLTTFYAETCMATWCVYTLINSPTTS